MQRLRQSAAHSSPSPSRAPSITPCRGLVIAYAAGPWTCVPPCTTRSVQVALYDRRRAKHTSRYNAPESEPALQEAASSSETSDRYTPDLDQLYMGACPKVVAQNRAHRRSLRHRLLRGRTKLIKYGTVCIDDDSENENTEHASDDDAQQRDLHPKEVGTANTAMLYRLNIQSSMTVLWLCMSSCRLFA